LKLFTNLHIPRTQDIKDTINGGSYVLYCIEYDAIKEIHFQEIDQSFSPSNPNPFLVRKTFTVYRRFSEFITLQKLLEKRKNVKKQMKAIKNPSSIQLTAQNLLMFSKLDSSTIEFRRIFLQNFLKELCNRESIARLPEMQQFLAYGSDAQIAFVNSKSQNILPLNINKVFYKGIKGAISLIKTTLPVEPQVGQIDPKFSDRINDIERLTVKTILTKVENHNIMQLEKKLNKWKENESDFTLINSFDNNEDITLTTTHLKNTCFSQRSKIDKILGPRSRGDGCEADDTSNPELLPFSEENTEYESKHSNQIKTSLSIKLINSLTLFLMHKVIYVWQLIAIKLIELLFGSIIEELVQIIT